MFARVRHAIPRLWQYRPTAPMGRGRELETPSTPGKSRPFAGNYAKNRPPLV